MQKGRSTTKPLCVRFHHSALCMNVQLAYKLLFSTFCLYLCVWERSTLEMFTLIKVFFEMGPLKAIVDSKHVNLCDFLFFFPLNTREITKKCWKWENRHWKKLRILHWIYAAAAPPTTIWRCTISSCVRYLFGFDSNRFCRWNHIFFCCCCCCRLMQKTLSNFFQQWYQWGAKYLHFFCPLENNRSISNRFNFGKPFSRW